MHANCSNYLPICVSHAAKKQPTTVSQSLGQMPLNHHKRYCVCENADVFIFCTLCLCVCHIAYGVCLTCIWVCIKLKIQKTNPDHLYFWLEKAFLLLLLLLLEWLILLKPFSCLGLFTYLLVLMFSTSFPLFVPPGQEKNTADGWVSGHEHSRAIMRCAPSLWGMTPPALCSSVALWFPALWNLFVVRFTADSY